MTQPFLPYGRQWLDEEDVGAVVDVLRGAFLTTGPTIEAFEAALRDLTGAKHAIVLNSGTSALHAMYAAAGLVAGDEIVTSPMTFAATANAAFYLGASVRFVDIEPDTGNIDPAAIDAAITDRTRLIVPVDYAGLPADYGRILPTAEARGIDVVADAAHSLGATWRGRPVGTLCRATEVSLHPVKPITAGEGGAVLTDDADLAARARRFRTHGITRDPAELQDNHGPWYYEQLDLGFNYRMTDIQAALGLSQARKLPRFIARRREVAAAYLAGLAGVDGIELPGLRDDADSGWHIFVIRTRDAAHRRPLFDRLRALGLGVQVHYLPVYLHPWYQQAGYRRGMCPAAEDFYARAISLPIFPAMTDDDIQRVLHDVTRAVREIVG